MAEKCDGCKHLFSGPGEDFEKMANNERKAKFEAAFNARAIPTDRPPIFRIVGKMDLK